MKLEKDELTKRKEERKKTLSQYIKKLLNIYNLNTREWRLFKDIVVVVLGNDLQTYHHQGRM